MSFFTIIYSIIPLLFILTLPQHVKVSSICWTRPSIRKQYPFIYFPPLRSTICMSPRPRPLERVAVKMLSHPTAKYVGRHSFKIPHHTHVDAYKYLYLRPCYTIYTYPRPRTLERLAVKMLSHPTARSVCRETLIQYTTSYTCRCL